MSETKEEQLYRAMYGKAYVKPEPAPYRPLSASERVGANLGRSVLGLPPLALPFSDHPDVLKARVDAEGWTAGKDGAAETVAGFVEFVRQKIEAAETKQ